jgi:hypothetical protein
MSTKSTRRDLLKLAAVTAVPAIVTLAPSNARAQGSWCRAEAPVRNIGFATEGPTQDPLLGTWAWREERARLREAEQHLRLGYTQLGPSPLDE